MEGSRMPAGICRPKVKAVKKNPMMAEMSSRKSDDRSGNGDYTDLQDRFAFEWVTR